MFLVNSQFFSSEPPRKKVRTTSVLRGNTNPSRHCDNCNIDVESVLWNAHLRTNRHKANSCQLSEDGVDIMKSAFKCRIISYKVSTPKFHVNIKSFRDEIKEKVLRVIELELTKHKLIKINFELFSLYYSQVVQSQEIKSQNTPYNIISTSTNLNDVYEDLFEIIDKKADEFAERDSGMLNIPPYHI